MSQNHGWKGRLPRFEAIHIDTPERFVGTTGNHRVSIAAVGNMGLWECDVNHKGAFIVDKTIRAKHMDDAIAQTLAAAGIISNIP